MVHLNNDAVQKQGEEYGKFETGNKLSLEEFQKFLDEHVPRSACFIGTRPNGGSGGFVVLEASSELDQSLIWKQKQLPESRSKNKERPTGARCQQMEKEIEVQPFEHFEPWTHQPSINPKPPRIDRSMDPPSPNPAPKASRKVHVREELMPKCHALMADVSGLI